MSRIKKIKKKITAPDLMYSNKLLTRFINTLMKDGKKSVAQSLVYDAFGVIKEKGMDPLSTFQAAIQNVGPKMEVRPRRVGGASYQVPMEVRGDRRISLAIRWIIQAARNRSSKEYRTFSAKLVAELLDANNNVGEAIKKRDVTYKMAEANKAFSHFRW